MEKPPSPKDNEIFDDNNFERDRDFFSKKNGRRFVYHGALIAGGLTTLVGTYELITKQKISHLLEQYRSDLPNILNATIAAIDSASATAKLLIASGFFASSALIRQIQDNDK